MGTGVGTGMRTRDGDQVWGPAVKTQGVDTVWGPALGCGCGPRCEDQPQRPGPLNSLGTWYEDQAGETLVGTRVGDQEGGPSVGSSHGDESWTWD